MCVYKMAGEKKSKEDYIMAYVNGMKSNFQCPEIKLGLGDSHMPSFYAFALQQQS